MNGTVVRVGYKYVYDLYYRVRNACLEYEFYCLDFLDWVKAGLAFNVLGAKDMSRHAAYFGRLYRQLRSGVTTVPEADLRLAVIRYYEDIFQLYQDHLVAQLHIASKRKDAVGLEPASLVLLPSFESLPELSLVLPKKTIVLEEYHSDNLEELYQCAATAYLPEGTLLTKGMSLMFDYGIKRENNGILLEVV